MLFLLWGYVYSQLKIALRTKDSFSGARQRSFELSSPGFGLSWVLGTAQVDGVVGTRTPLPVHPLFCACQRGENKRGGGSLKFLNLTIFIVTPLKLSFILFSQKKGTPEAHTSCVCAATGTLNPRRRKKKKSAPHLSRQLPLHAGSPADRSTVRSDLVDQGVDNDFKGGLTRGIAKSLPKSEKYARQGAKCATRLGFNPE